ncbi:MAG: hypothetical protein JJU33_01870 [Phycisphaerales bacterium]|nr:hypothetical protein [Phycisphaerales bacterium]
MPETEQTSSPASGDSPGVSSGPASGGGNVWALPEGVTLDTVRPSAWQKPWVGDALLTVSGPHELPMGRIAVVGALIVFCVLMMAMPLLLVTGALSGAMATAFLLPFGVMIGVFIVGAVCGLRHGRREYARREDLARARRAFFVVSHTVAILLMTLLLWAAMFTGWGQATMPAFASFFGFWAVFTLIGLVTPVRLGPELRCARCDYPFETGHGDQCPECGSKWRGPLSLVRGERKSANLALIALLAAIVLPTVTIGFVSTFGDGARFMTTESLIRRAVNPSPTDFRGPWAELARRTLTEDQTLRLARGVLDYPAGAFVLTVDEGVQWLEGRVIAGEIPREMMEELLEDRLALGLQVAGSAVVGGQLGVTLDQRVEGIGGRSLHYIVAVGGYRHSGGGAAIERGSFFSALPRAPHGQGIVVQLAPPTVVSPGSAGDFEVGFDCWLFLTDQAHHGRISWGPDGTPDPPPGTLAVVHKEAVTTLRVGAGP